jgi:hypothetical protein
MDRFAENETDFFGADRPGLTLFSRPMVAAISASLNRPEAQVPEGQVSLASAARLPRIPSLAEHQVKKQLEVRPPPR